MSSLSEPDWRHIDLLSPGRYLVSIIIYQVNLTYVALHGIDRVGSAEGGELFPPNFLRPRPHLIVMFDVVWKGDSEHISQLNEVSGRAWT